MRKLWLAEKSPYIATENLNPALAVGHKLRPISGIVDREIRLTLVGSSADLADYQGR